MANSKYPGYLDNFPYQINTPEGRPDISAEDINLIQEAIKSVQETLGTRPQGDSNSVKARLKSIEKESLNKNIPLNLTTRVVENEDGEKAVEVSWSYVESDDLDHFVLEVWDEETQSYKPYDGQLGVIETQV